MIPTPMNTSNPTQNSNMDTLIKSIEEADGIWPCSFFNCNAIAISLGNPLNGLASDGFHHLPYLSANIGIQLVSSLYDVIERKGMQVTVKRKFDNVEALPQRNLRTKIELS